MAFKNLDTKTRYDIIRTGVRAGITKVKDIEHIFDEGGDTETQKNKRINYDNKGAVIGSAIGNFIGGVPGYFIGQALGSGAIRRGAEVVMRSSQGEANPLDVIQDSYTKLKSDTYKNDYKEELQKEDWRKKEDKNRIKAVAKYILTGTPTGRKGYYNSIEYNPDDYYSGHKRNVNGNDIIDAALYGKTIDPKYGYELVSIGNSDDFGTNKEYIEKNYKNKENNIPVYRTISKDENDTPITLDLRENGNIKDYRTIEDYSFLDFANEGTEPQNTVDVGGYNEIRGTDKQGNRYHKAQDIWKFLPEDYINKWKDHIYGPNKLEDIEKIQTKRKTGEKLTNSELIDLLKYKSLEKTINKGLSIVDRMLTPVITTGNWQKMSKDEEIERDNLLKIYYGK